MTLNLRLAMLSMISLSCAMILASALAEAPNYSFRGLGGSERDARAAAMSGAEERCGDGRVEVVAWECEASARPGSSAVACELEYRCK